jgi:glycerate 2-kinase
MIIKNKDELATTELRKMALEIVEAGITRVLPTSIMRSAISYDSAHRTLTVSGDAYPVSRGRIFVIGGGKASGLMAEELENLVGYENITDGFMTCKANHFKTRKIRLVQASHPIPDQRGATGVQKMLSLKDQYAIGRDDLVLCLISGGGSASMPCPADGVSLRDKQEITDLLLASGAEIGEINAVRKHLSRVKGGRLGQFYAPATVISLILSDVIGNDLSVISSGPTFPDSSTFADAYEVLKRYDLLSKAPVAVVEFLKKGCRGLVAETPKALENCHNYIIGDNNLALQAMVRKASEMGLHPHIITAEQKGDTAAIAWSRARDIKNAENSAYDVLLLGGETTLKLPCQVGKGGRNQHYAVVSLLAMEEYKGEWVMASVGTDGSDFISDVAGAIVDTTSLRHLRSKDLDVQQCLDYCDSYTLLSKLGNSIIVTGNTGTNVGDIIVYVLKRGCAITPKNN